MPGCAAAAGLAVDGLRPADRIHDREPAVAEDHARPRDDPRPVRSPMGELIGHSLDQPRVGGAVDARDSADERSLRSRPGRPPARVPPPDP